jgi:hypothetical protein
MSWDDEDGDNCDYEEYEECEEYDDTEQIKALTGLMIGFSCIILGVILSIFGVTGYFSWSFAFGGINSSLTNAAPGVLLMIIGFFIIFITNYKVIIQK